MSDTENLEQIRARVQALRQFGKHIAGAAEDCLKYLDTKDRGVEAEGCHPHAYYYAAMDAIEELSFSTEQPTDDLDTAAEGVLGCALDELFVATDEALGPVPEYAQRVQATD